MNSSPTPTMSRDEFISSMIKALELKTTENSNYFEISNKLTSEEVFSKFCFDFPIISDDEIQNLCDDIFAWVKINLERSSALSKYFYFHEKFIDNLVSFSSEASKVRQDSSSCDKRGSSIGLLNATIFVQIPSILIECDEEMCFKFFQLDSYHYNSILRGSITTQGSCSSHWHDILICIRNHVKLCSTSSFTSIDTANMIKLDLLSYFSRVVDYFSYFLFDNNQISQPNFAKDVSNKTLKNFLCTLYIAKSEDSSCAIEWEIIYGIMKDIWIQSVFLARDLLSQYPALINSKSLGLIPHKLLAYVTKDSLSHYPSTPECIFILCLADITSSVLGPNNSNPSNISSRKALRLYIEQNITTIGEISESIFSHGSDGGNEAFGILFPVISFFVAETGIMSHSSKSFPPLHEKLVASRIISISLQILIQSLEREKNSLSNDISTSIVTGTSAAGGGAGIANAKNVLGCLASLCFQSQHTGCYILKMPGNLLLLQQYSQFWMQLNDESGVSFVGTEVTCDLHRPWDLSLTPAIGSTVFISLLSPAIDASTFQELCDMINSSLKYSHFCLRNCIDAAVLVNANDTLTSNLALTLDSTESTTLTTITSTETEIIGQTNGELLNNLLSKQDDHHLSRQTAEGRNKDLLNKICSSLQFSLEILSQQSAGIHFQRNCPLIVPILAKWVDDLLAELNRIRGALLSSSIETTKRCVKALKSLLAGEVNKVD